MAYWVKGGFPSQVFFLQTSGDFNGLLRSCFKQTCLGSSLCNLVSTSLVELDMIEMRVNH